MASVVRGHFDQPTDRKGPRPAPALTFGLNTLLLLVSLCGVLCGLWTLEPLLGGIVTVLLAPVLWRTGHITRATKIRGESLSTSGLLTTFVDSVVVVLMLLTVAFVTFLASALVSLALVTAIHLCGGEAFTVLAAVLGFLSTCVVSLQITHVVGKPYMTARRRRGAADQATLGIDEYRLPWREALARPSGTQQDGRPPSQR